ncbi:hypothetical protein BJY04DRAFT_215048 [Aspergillus karnatakaensis]|uniref:uncharacterized protein n=1 Tax=Aspergillus karnatakaensis TaxID=1810916 RepID=UPI003CCCB263
MLTHSDYRIGWICALSIELAAAEAMLDVVHDPLPARVGDGNTYVLGSIGLHNIVVACLPAGVYGTTSATSVAMHMRTSFPSLRFSLMVGVAGGAPSPEANIRLGDVVVSKPTAGYGGVIQYDYGKALAGEFRSTGFLDKPPAVLLTAIARLQARHHLYGSNIQETTADLLTRYRHLSEKFLFPGHDRDLLFLSSYDHNSKDKPWCDGCDRSMLEPRPLRHLTAPSIFYGLIACANQIPRDPVKRDSLSHRHGILCFEMEAAGLMDVLPCLIIRGICDYSDSHKNKEWQGYAAINAAAYARELLSVIPFHELAHTPAADPSASYVDSSNYPLMPEEGQLSKQGRTLPSQSRDSANNSHSGYCTLFDRVSPDTVGPLKSTPNSIAGIWSSPCHKMQGENSRELDIVSLNASEPAMPSPSGGCKRKLMIGIDIGSRYTQISYATTEEIASGHINSIASWPNGAELVNKVPTLVSYNNWRYAWGYSIPEQQIPLPWLWAILLTNEDMNQFTVLRTEDIPKSERVRGPLPCVEDLKATHALSHYLRALWNHTTEIIRHHLGSKTVDSLRFHVLLTLPTVWDQTGSQEMRRAARLSGIQDRRTAGQTSLSVTRRSTAAAQAAIYESVTSVHVGDTYVICYAGGRTIEATAYKVSQPSAVDMCRSVGRKWVCCGGDELDSAFKSLLNRSANAMGHRLSEVIGDYIMAKEWEGRIKRKFRLRGPSDIFPLRLTQHTEKSARINDVLRSELKRATSTLRAVLESITPTDIAQVFAKTISTIQDLIKDQLRRAQDQGSPVKGIILAGGVGSSLHVLDCLAAEYGPQIPVIPAENPAFGPSAACRGTLYQAYLEPREAEEPAALFTEEIDSTPSTELSQAEVTAPADCEDGSISSTNAEDTFMASIEAEDDSIASEDDDDLTPISELVYLNPWGGR